MRTRFIPMLIASAFLLAGCSSPSDSATQGEITQPNPSPSAVEPEFEWTKELLFEAMLDPKLVESWGYEVGVYGKSEVKDFVIDSQGSVDDEDVTVKPFNCELVYSFALSEDKIGAEYYSLLMHSDQSYLDTGYFINFIYTFESKESAKQIFAQLVADQEQCGSFTYLEGGEVLSWKIWDAPTINQPDLLVGVNDSEMATAFGLNGSAIWTLQIQKTSSSDSSEVTAILAATEINKNLTAIQAQ